MGRPTSYDPTFCDTAIEHLSLGYSTTALAGHIGVGRATVYRWAEEHDEFRDALKAGQAAGVQWWEGRLRAIGEGKEGNATAAIFALKNRGADDWREVSRTELTGKGGGPVQTEEVASDAASFASRMAALASRMEALANRAAEE